MQNPFYPYDLPEAEMIALGIVDAEGSSDISEVDWQALQAGRRTSLFHLKNLNAEGFWIQNMDAKLSYGPNTLGKLVFNLHPVYAKPEVPFILENSLARALLKGEIYQAQVQSNIPPHKHIAFEYDTETKEFVSYDPEDVIIPECINNFKLTESQREAFKAGRVVTLPDGTHLVYKATEPAGLLSGCSSLILSVSTEEGVAFQKLAGINHLYHSRKAQIMQTPAYDKAFACLKAEIERQFRDDRNKGPDIKGQFI